MNRIILMGRLVADPELRQTPNNIPVCKFRLAVNRAYGKDGEQAADFFNIVAWRKTGEFAHKYFAKGRMICVEGEAQNRAYTGKDGVERQITEVIADRVHFTGEKAAGGDCGGEDEDEDYPF